MNDLSVFKKIPFFNSYEINSSGLIRNCLTKKDLTHRKRKSKSGNEFLSVNMVMDSGVRTSRTIKGLICLVWKQ